LSFAFAGELRFGDGDWSAKHADYVDPLTDLKWMLGQFKNLPWHFGAE
jgi:hypothetical protein